MLNGLLTGLTGLKVSEIRHENKTQFELNCCYYSFCVLSCFMHVSTNLRILFVSLQSFIVIFRTYKRSKMKLLIVVFHELISGKSPGTFCSDTRAKNRAALGSHSAARERGADTVSVNVRLYPSSCVGIVGV